MILIVMSDSHDNRGAIRTALEIGKGRGAQEIIHCGDVCTTSTLEEFSGWTLHLAFGNADRDWNSMRTRIARLGNQSECGQEIHMFMDGLRITVLHGDSIGLMQACLFQGETDFLFSGHTHRQSDETQNGVRVINPGALGGVASELHSFCLLDTARRQVEFVRLEDNSQSPE
jgi:uncharacterized protein